MSKVTSKLQVTLPRMIADQFGIRPGDEIEWLATGDAIRVLLPSRPAALDLESRLKLFDEATRRQREREARRGPIETSTERGWKREELYDRGRFD